MTKNKTSTASFSLKGAARRVFSLALAFAVAIAVLPFFKTASDAADQTAAYNYRLVWNTTNSHEIYEMSAKDSGISIYYKADHGRAAETQQTDDLDGTTSKDIYESRTTREWSGTLPGFPMGIHFGANFRQFAVNDQDFAYSFNLYVNDQLVLSDSVYIEDIGNWYGSGGDFMSNWVRGDHYADASMYPYPVSAKTNGSTTVYIPYSVTGATIVPTSGYYNISNVVDQYGVSWDAKVATENTLYTDEVEGKNDLYGEDGKIDFAAANVDRTDKLTWVYNTANSAHSVVKFPMNITVVTPKELRIDTNNRPVSGLDRTGYVAEGDFYYGYAGEVRNLGRAIPDSENGYRFTGWTLVEGVGSVSGTTFTVGNGNATVKANFTMAKPVVTFTDKDDNVLKTVEVEYNGAVESSQLPPRSNNTTTPAGGVPGIWFDSAAHYTFNGWPSSQYIGVKDDITIKASYTAAAHNLVKSEFIPASNSYVYRCDCGYEEIVQVANWAVTFLDDEGNVIKFPTGTTQTVVDPDTGDEHEEPVFADHIDAIETPTNAFSMVTPPVKPATAQYNYTFIGWTQVAIDNDAHTATYQATYSDAENEYVVRFYSVDGRVNLGTFVVKYGEIVREKYPAAIDDIEQDIVAQIRTAHPDLIEGTDYDDVNHYSFVGWTHSIDAPAVSAYTVRPQLAGEAHRYEYISLGEEGGTPTHMKICSYGHESTIEECTVEDVDVAPTCIRDGYTAKQCKYCSYEKDKVIVPATGHDYEYKVIDKPGLYTEGLIKGECKNGCGISVNVEVPSLNNVNYTVECTATAESAGFNKYTWNDNPLYKWAAGHEQGIYVELIETEVQPLGWNVRYYSEDTKTELANIRGVASYDGIADAYLDAGYALPEKDPTVEIAYVFDGWVQTDEVAADGIDPDTGEPTVLHIAVDGKNEADGIANVKASFVETPRKYEVTFVAGGAVVGTAQVEYNTLAELPTDFPDFSYDKDNYYKVTSWIGLDQPIVADTTIEAVYETFPLTKEVVEPGCLDQGYTLYKCEQFGFETKDDYTDPVGHRFGAWSDDETGLNHVRHCTKCDAVETHVWDVWENQGVSKHVRHCTNPNCDQTQIHDWGAWENYSESQHRRVCVQDPEHVEYGYHRFVDLVPIQATCTHSGLTAGLECTVCGIIEPQEEIPMIDHVDEDENGYCDWCGLDLTDDAACPYCGEVHTGSIIQIIIRYIHIFLHFFTSLFG